MAIAIGPGQGECGVLYDHNKNYNQVLVAPTSADLFWAYDGEEAAASHYLANVPLGIEVSVPLNTEVDRDIIIRAIPRTAYSRNPSIGDLDTAEQATGVSTRHDATPALNIVGKVGSRHARISIDNWNRFARVRRVDISTDEDFVGFTSIYFDLDQNSATLGGAGTAAEFNELPDYFDIDRPLPAYPDPVDPDGETYYVRVAHSAESSARATGATYKDKVDSLRYTEFSDTLEVIFADAGTDNGSIGAGGIGPGTSYQYPDTGGSGLIEDISVSAVQQRLADAYGPGILSNDAVYGQWIGGRKLWTAQQIHAQGAVGDWVRDEGAYRPLTLGGLSAGPREDPTLPPGSPLVYGAGSLYALQGMMSYTNDTAPSVFAFYRATHNGAGAVDDPILPDTGLGRIAPAVWTSEAWRYSGRIDFTLDGEAEEDGDDVNVPVAVDIYGGWLSSIATEATGTRGLRVDRYGNAVLGVGALADDAVGGFPYIPQFVDEPTEAPAATHTGYLPIAFVGETLKAYDGAAWIAISGGGGTPAGVGSEIQFKDGTAFGAVTGSSVSGADLTLAGNFTTQSDDMQFYVPEAGADAYLYNFSSGFPPQLNLARARGTRTSPTDISAGDGLGRLQWLGRVSGSYNTFAAIIGVYGASSTSRLVADVPYFYTTSSLIVGQSAISTSATDGFLYAPSCAGVPTGTPTTQTGTVPIVFDTTNSRFYARLGGAWVNLTGSGATPAGSGSEIQYRSSGTVFGAVSNSSVSGSDITLGGNFTIQSSTAQTSFDEINADQYLIQFNASYGAQLNLVRARGTRTSPTDISDGDGLGRIDWYGRVGGSYASYGALTTVYGAGGTSRMVAIANNFEFTGSAIVGQSALTTTATDGFLYAPSCVGVPTGTPTTHTGTVPIVFDTSNNRLYARLGGSWTNLSAATNPAGSGSELQYRSSGTAFGAITGSSVSGADITLIGNLAIQSDDMLFSVTEASQDVYLYQFSDGFGPQLNLSRARNTRSSPNNISGGDSLGRVQWNGRVGGSYATYAALIGIYGASTTSKLVADVPYFFTTSSLIVGQAAISTSATDGFLYLPSCAGVPSGTPTSQTGTIPVVVDTSNSRLYARLSGAWINLTGGGGSPGGSGSELQYRSGSSTFGAISNSSVSGGRITLGGGDGSTVTYSQVLTPGEMLITEGTSGTPTTSSSPALSIVKNHGAASVSGVGAGLHVDYTNNYAGQSFQQANAIIVRNNAALDGDLIGLGVRTIAEGVPGTNPSFFSLWGYCEKTTRADAGGGEFSLNLQYSRTITGATNANPIVITTSAPHYLVTGDEVAISSVGGNTAAIGLLWAVTVTGPNTFSIPVAGNGAYTSGGVVYLHSARNYSTTGGNRGYGLGIFIGASPSYSYATALLAMGSGTPSVARAWTGIDITPNSIADETLRAIRIPFNTFLGSWATNNTDSYHIIGLGGGNIITIDPQGLSSVFGSHVTIYSALSGLAAASASMKIYGSSDKERFEAQSITGSPGYMGKRANGTLGTPTPPISGDILNFLGGSGLCGNTSTNHDAAGWYTSQAGAVFIFASETWSNSPHRHGCYVSIQTTPNGSTTRAERVKIDDTVSAFTTPIRSTIGNPGQVYINEGGLLPNVRAYGYGTANYPQASFYYAEGTQTSPAAIGSSDQDFGRINFYYKLASDTLAGQIIARQASGEQGIVIKGTNTNPSISIYTNLGLQINVDGSGATGDLLYRTSTGYLARLGVGTAGQVLTVASGLPSWGAGGGGSPAGSGSEIQYRNAGAFGAITSTVNSTDITFTGYDFTYTKDGTLTLQQKSYGTGVNAQWALHRGRGTAASPTAIQSGDTLAAINFSAQYDTSTSVTAFNIGASIQAVAAATWDASNTPTDIIFKTKSGIALSSITALRITSDQRVGVGSNIAHATIAAQFHVVGTTRFDVGSDATGDIHYRDASGFFVRLAAGTNGHVLTLASGLPSWAAASGGGSPGGSSGQLQYNNSGSFGGISSSSVSGAHVTLGGNLTLSTTSPTFYLDSLGTQFVSATQQFQKAGSAGGNINTTEALGAIAWAGKISGSYTNLITIIATRQASVDVLTMQAGTGQFVLSNAITTSSAGFAATIGTGTFEVAGTVASTAGLNVFKRLDLQSTGTVADGWGMRTTYQLESTTTTACEAAYFDVYWQESTHASRSSMVSISTVYKGQTAPIRKQILGGYKDLIDATAVDIFSVVFGTTDHKAVTGRVILHIQTKQTSGGNQIQAFTRTVPFMATHNGANNTGQAIWDVGAQAAATGGSSTGSATFIYRCNTVNGSGGTYAVNANTYTFSLEVNTDFTVPSEFFCQYRIELDGETDVTILP